MGGGKFHQEVSGPTMQDLHDWLTRHLLDPNSAELLVPMDFTLALRARLLAKVRDDARRERGFRTIRIDAATAHWLDLLARLFEGVNSGHARDTPDSR